MSIGVAKQKNIYKSQREGIKHPSVGHSDALFNNHEVYTLRASKMSGIKSYPVQLRTAVRAKTRRLF